MNLLVIVLVNSQLLLVPFYNSSPFIDALILLFTFMISLVLCLRFPLALWPYLRQLFYSLVLLSGRAQ
jgi:hypothetical protein